ncbi:MAG TPA: alpha/beta fold hydrolase [Solirubrobacteraceae bacterium]|nr:alpha/beta fold hydrolase [Solirubrobacteraceae bacterium]
MSARRPPQVQTREVVLHGHRISYRQGGEGPVILLVHGIAGSAQTWTETQRQLGRDFNTIAPDLPGHGVSDKPVGDYSLGSLASTLRDLLVALGHERATIVGHSLGGGVAMQFAYQFPERCERLVLVSSGGLGRDVNLLLRAACLPGADLFLSAVSRPLSVAGTSVGGALGRLGWRPAPDLEEVARGFASLADTPTRRAFLHTLRSVVGTTGQRVDASDRLYLAAEMPTLLVWGERDPIIPAHHARTAHELMPGSRLVTFPASGHMPHIDEPHLFCDTLLEFIESTEPADVTADRWGELLRGGPPSAPGASRRRRARAKRSPRQARARAGRAMR